MSKQTKHFLLILMWGVLFGGHLSSQHSTKFLDLSGGVDIYGDLYTLKLEKDLDPKISLYGKLQLLNNGYIAGGTVVYDSTFMDTTLISISPTYPLNDRDQFSSLFVTGGVRVYMDNKYSYNSLYGNFGFSYEQFLKQVPDQVKNLYFPLGIDLGTGYKFYITKDWNIDLHLGIIGQWGYNLDRDFQRESSSFIDLTGRFEFRVGYTFGGKQIFISKAELLKVKNKS